MLTRQIDSLKKRTYLKYDRCENYVKFSDCLAGQVSFMKTMNAIELAQFILASYSDRAITPMKLQKLAYYAKVWTLIAKESFLKINFEKWPYGPVNRDIYNNYKKYGAEIIPSPEKDIPIGNTQKELLHFILDNYADYSAFTLSAMTHNEDPWLKTKDGCLISKEDILTYYSTQPFAKNFQKRTGQPFHLVRSNSWYSFTLDMDKEQTDFFATYPSNDALKQQRSKVKDDFQKLLNNLETLF